MKRRTDKVMIISELHPQHGGDINALETMILQSKLSGADAVKVQLYSSQLLFGDSRKEYAELTFEELKRVKKYSDDLGIDLFASVFDKERLRWAEDLDFKYHKIASRTVDNSELCEAIISTGKQVFVSNGCNNSNFPYDSSNVIYFYCTAKYPTLIEDISIPNFSTSRYEGYSDHTPGITSAITAIVQGAKYIEKHFSISKCLQASCEKAHFGSMDLKELSFLRAFSDEFVLIGKK